MGFLDNFYTGWTCLAAEDCDALKMVWKPADEWSDEEISAAAAAVGVGTEVATGQKKQGKMLLDNVKDAAGGWIPTKLEIGLYGLAALAVLVFVAKKA